MLFFASLVLINCGVRCLFKLLSDSFSVISFRRLFAFMYPDYEFAAFSHVISFFLVNVLQHVQPAKCDVILVLHIIQ